MESFETFNAGDQAVGTGILPATKRAFRQNRTLIILTFAFLALTYISAWSKGLADHYRVSLYSGSGALALLASAFVIGVGYVLYLGLVEKERRPLGRMLSEINVFFADFERPASVLIPLFVAALVVSAYSSFKAMIPALEPFALDALFAEWDRSLHFGVDPWRITHALFGSIITTGVINFVYHLWFFVIWGVLLWQALALKQRRRRMQFFIAFVLLWGLLGALMAVLASSAGPVYFGDITGLPDPFLPLMERLHDIDAELVAAGSPFRLWALDIQDWLWQLYQTGENGIGAGISAMPSMHVGLAALVALVARRSHAAIAWSAWLFLAFIQIGSVHLGWHYAIDGYVAIAFTLILWKLAGMLAERAIGHERKRHLIQS